jgi:hypothetical protein
MNMTGKLTEYFNKQPRLSVLSTSNKNGKLDSAVIGSPQMTGEKTGIRVYLKMSGYVTSGPQIDAYKSQIAKVVGEQEADMIKVLATFEVTEVRPLIDFGQGWEKSI